MSQIPFLVNLSRYFGMARKVYEPLGNEEIDVFHHYVIPKKRRQPSKLFLFFPFTIALFSILPKTPHFIKCDINEKCTFVFENVSFQKAEATTGFYVAHIGYLIGQILTGIGLALLTRLLSELTAEAVQNPELVSDKLGVRVWQLTKEAWFSFVITGVGIFLFSVFSTLCNNYVLELLIFIGWPVSFIISAVFSSYIFFKKWTPNELYDLNSPICISIGELLAFGNYMGFHKIILDRASSRDQCLETRIQNYEYKHGVSIPSKKLYILLPKSCHLPSDLSICDRDGMEMKQKLEPMEIDRGGVRRQYNNTVYKIIKGQKEVHLVSEIATSLITLKDMKTNCYGLHQEDLVEQYHHFCRHLKYLLDCDADCRNTYVLVYFDDSNSEKTLSSVLWSYYENEKIQRTESANTQNQSFSEAIIA